MNEPKPAALCGECGAADFQKVDWKGREWSYRGKLFLVPESLVMDTCPNCQAVRGSGDDALRLDGMFSSMLLDASAVKEATIPSVVVVSGTPERASLLMSLLAAELGKRPSDSEILVLDSMQHRFDPADLPPLPPLPPFDLLSPLASNRRAKRAAKNRRR